MSRNIIIDLSPKPSIQKEVYWNHVLGPIVSDQNQCIKFWESWWASSGFLNCEPPLHLPIGISPRVHYFTTCQDSAFISKAIKVIGKVLESLTPAHQPAFTLPSILRLRSELARPHCVFGSMNPRTSARRRQRVTYWLMNLNNAF